jgi:hypothetical protein
MTMLHPNQYVYYNAFVGGVEGAQRKFNLDYWANSYAEAVQGLEDYLRARYGLGFVEREFTVAVCGPPYSAEHYFPENFRFTEEEDQADFFIAFTKDDCDRSLPGRPIYEVKRMGALLSVVLDRRDILAVQRSADNQRWTRWPIGHLNLLSPVVGVSSNFAWGGFVYKRSAAERHRTKILLSSPSGVARYSFLPSSAVMVA